MYARIVKYAAAFTSVVLAMSAYAGDLAGQSIILGQAGFGQIEHWMVEAQTTANLSPEPESYTMILAGIGLMMMVVFRRRRKPG